MPRSTTDGARIAMVTPRLAVGLSCREPEHTADLRRLGVTHWADHRRTRCDSELLATLPQVDYLWNPTRDDGEPKPVEWYWRTIEFGRRALQGPQSVLFVSCARGEHRSPSMAYAVLRAGLSVERSEALQVLSEAWPSGNPWYADDVDSKLADLV